MIATKLGLCSRKINTSFRSFLDLNQKEEKISKMHPEYVFLKYTF